MIGCDKNWEGCYYVVPLSFKEIKNFAFLTCVFLINFCYKLVKVRVSTLYRRFPFLIFHNSNGFQMMYRQLM